MKKFGRKRSFQDAPRTLDIDIIFFDNKKIDIKVLLSLTKIGQIESQ